MQKQGWAEPWCGCLGFSGCSECPRIWTVVWICSWPTHASEPGKKWVAAVEYIQDIHQSCLLGRTEKGLEKNLHLYVSHTQKTGWGLPSLPDCQDWAAERVVRKCRKICFPLFIKLRFSGILSSPFQAQVIWGNLASNYPGTDQYIPSLRP